MASDDPLVVVGTHALVQEAPQFARLGFVAIDEQHRFGVEQREAIAGKGEAPDVLLMTATPIPRSLALTLIRRSRCEHARRAAARSPADRDCHTPRVGARASVRSSFDREVEAGRQAYVVYPVIEESEKIDLKAATVMFDQLSASVFADLPNRAAPRADSRGGARRRDARISRRRDRHPRCDDGDRGWNRRAQRDCDADRASGALRPVAAAPAARARWPRRRSEHTASCSEMWATNLPSDSQYLRVPKTVSRLPGRTSGCAVWAISSDNGRAASRCSALPIRCATRR